MRPKLLILGDAVENDFQAYRGTWRLKPLYRHEYGDEHPVNEAWYWWANEDESAVVHDVIRALELIRLYRTHVGQEFELLEATLEDAKPLVGTKLLGYDISEWFTLSLLSRGLRKGGDPSCPECTSIDPLLRLLSAYFAPLLNENGLLPDHETATFCLECMAALQMVHPNLWESRFDFQAVGLYLVETPAEARPL